MKKESGTRFSVYFHESQIKYLDKEAEKMGVSRSKFIELKCLPKDLQFLQNRKGAKKVEQ
jgi:hypothetical protein